MNWSEKTNWYDSDTPTHVAPAAPGTGARTSDTVTFDSTATQGCNMDVSVTVAGITLAGGTNSFPTTMPLTLTAGNYAVVKGGTFEFDGGTLNFANGTHLDLDKSTGKWKGGDFSPTSAGGTVYLYSSTPGGSATLTILADAQKLGASLVIGESPSGSDSTATLNVSTTDSGMSGNLTLYKNATITNDAQGTINFNQSVNCDTKGGIILDAGSTGSTITNRGTIIRDVVNSTNSTDPNKQLKVLAAITQQDNDSASFNVGVGCWLYLNVPGRVGPDLNVTSGTVVYGAGAHITASIKMGPDAKKIEVGAAGGAGAVNFYVDGDLTTDGGAIVFDYTPGAWGVLNVSGNLAVGGGTAVDVNVDGTTSGNSDQIAVAGTATLTSGTVSADAQGSSATASYSYTLLTASSGISGTWGSSPTNAGSYGDTWVWDSGGQGVLDCTNAPGVTSLSSSAGPTAGGTSVTITGSSFVGVTAVKFGSTAATTFTVNSPTSITATAPAGSPGTVNVTVTTGYGTSATSGGDQFTYVAAPGVMGISPNTGTPAGGTSVSISGSHFTGATAVYFGGTAATSFTVNSDGSITAVSPAGSLGAVVDVTVVTAGGTSATSSGDKFTYYAPAPSVMSVSPNSGPTSGGTTVTIYGSHFTGATAVYFGGVAATSFTVNSDGSITAIAPPGLAGTVDITIVGPGGTSATNPGDEFTYT